MKAKDLKVGDLVSIYYDSHKIPRVFIDTMGVITEIAGYKSTVLVDGALEGWAISDLKKMAAHKKISDRIADHFPEGVK